MTLKPFYDKCAQKVTNREKTTYTKYNRKNIPGEFMNDSGIIEMLNEKIRHLEANQHEQTCIDNSYDDMVNILISQMDIHLNPKQIDSNINKKRRSKKPWWTEQLSLIWNELCKYEKAWLKSKDSSNKKNKKQEYTKKKKRV